MELVCLWSSSERTKQSRCGNSAVRGGVRHIIVIITGIYSHCFSSKVLVPMCQCGAGGVRHRVVREKVRVETNTKS